MITTLLLDMDNTLYSERDYVLSGLTAIAEHLNSHDGINAIEALAYMVEILDHEGRGKIFNRTLEYYSLPSSDETIQALVQIYRNHKPSIRLYDGVFETIHQLKSTYKLAIVTDGMTIMQQRKVAALSLDTLIDTIVYSWAEDAPKPDPKGFQKALDLLGSTRQQAMIIGDNPVNDGEAAAALNIPFVQVMTDNHPHANNNAIESFNHLPNYLDQLI